VIDARTRAIYVIGGQNGGATYFNDVLVSTDGGARPDYVGRGGVVGGIRGELAEYLGRGPAV
jgi:hypothetical protein